MNITTEELELLERLPSIISKLKEGVTTVESQIPCAPSNTVFDRVVDESSFEREQSAQQKFAIVAYMETHYYHRHRLQILADILNEGADLSEGWYEVVIREDNSISVTHVLDNFGCIRFTEKAADHIIKYFPDFVREAYKYEG
jgi:hypoxanthine-guanine phosphoribosyltransferase